MPFPDKIGPNYMQVILRRCSWHNHKVQIKLKTCLRREACAGFPRRPTAGSPGKLKNSNRSFFSFFSWDGTHRGCREKFFLVLCVCHLCPWNPPCRRDRTLLTIDALRIDQLFSLPMPFAVSAKLHPVIFTTPAPMGLSMVYPDGNGRFKTS